MIICEDGKPGRMYWSCFVLLKQVFSHQARRQPSTHSLPTVGQSSYVRVSRISKHTSNTKVYSRTRPGLTQGAYSSVASESYSPQHQPEQGVPGHPPASSPPCARCWCLYCHSLFQHRAARDTSQWPTNKISSPKWSTTATPRTRILFPNRASSPWTCLDPLMIGRAFQLTPKRQNTMMHGRVCSLFPHA